MKNRTLGSGALVLLLATAVYAASQQTFKASSYAVIGYDLDKQTNHYRDVAAVDSTGSESVRTTIQPFYINGRANFPLSIRTEVEDASVTFRVYAYYDSYFLGQSSDITVTVSDTQDQDLLFVAPTHVLDSFGANILRVAIVTHPTGNVRIVAGSY